MTIAVEPPPGERQGFGHGSRTIMNRKQRRRREKEVHVAEKTAAALLQRAAGFYDQGRLSEALKLCRRAVEKEPGNFAAQSNLGNVLARLGKSEKAAEAYGHALAMEPSSVPVLSNMALLKAETGDSDGALGLYRRILEIDPTDAEVLHDLSLLKTFASGDPDLAAMEKLRAELPTDSEKTMFLDFTLAKVLDDLGDHDRAFERLASANRLKRASLDYDVARDEALADRIIGAFDKPFLDALGTPGHGDDKPIFIIGMPRSGTTLVEQILASHSQVVGAGELNHFRDVVMGFGGAGPGVKGLGASGQGFPEGVRDLIGGDFQKLGKAYAGLLGQQAPDARRVTDKMPRNFFFAGLIALTLPAARIIHCRRHPVATCFSCFQIHFPEGQEFTYDLGELGRYHRLHDRLMEHWRAVLPGRIFDLGYEDLVAEPEARMRELLEFAGLDWEDACLEFHNTGRRVRTASAQQVRQPLYRTAVERWKRYEKHLGPLIDALGPGGFYPLADGD
ncbi:MAG: sulfotransferase [Proteobacteria bacterium]|nr:sulfotransferase [Pseudomonadota bacterium]